MVHRTQIVLAYFYQGLGALPIGNLREGDGYVSCGARALLRGAGTCCFTVYDELMMRNQSDRIALTKNARLSHTSPFEVHSSQRTSPASRLFIAITIHEALTHLSFNAHLLGKEQL